MVAIPTTYDSIFELLRGSQSPVVFPLAFMRALAWRESRMNPINKTGDHWGLFQVSSDVVSDWNKQAGVGELSHEDMLTPTYNTQVWVWYEARYLALYQRWAKQGTAAQKALKRNLIIDWNNAEFVKLAIASWNSGPGAVYKTAQYLVTKNLPVTHDNFFRYAHEVKPALPPVTYSGAKRDFQRGVSALYREIQTGSPPAPVSAQAPVTPSSPAGDLTPSKKPGIGGLGWLLLLGLMFLTLRRD